MWGRLPGRAPGRGGPDGAGQPEHLPVQRHGPGACRRSSTRAPTSTRGWSPPPVRSSTRRTCGCPATPEVHRFVPHVELMPRASLMVGHGGHGTTLQALAHDLPMVLMPMHPMLDQPMVARSVAAGRRRARRDARRRPLPDLRPVIASLLADGPHRTAAARLGREIRALRGPPRGREDRGARRGVFAERDDVFRGLRPPLGTARPRRPAGLPGGVRRSRRDPGALPPRRPRQRAARRRLPHQARPGAVPDRGPRPARLRSVDPAARTNRVTTSTATPPSD